ncbi:hypothetical protein ABPG77_011185 [Micractinium sp. CCAP 211/92]
MASKLSAVVLGTGPGALLRGNGRRTAVPLAAAAVGPLLARQPDPGPSRNPDIYPPGWQHPDSPVPDPLNPDPDLYPPDVGVPRRDPDVLPPRPPAPDIYPPGDTPDMPEPPVPGKGPFMHLGRAAASRPIPADSHKWCGSWGAAGSTPPRAQQGGCASRANSPALLLKTDGGNVWLEARAMHGTAFWAEHAEQGGGKGAQEDLEERGMPSKEGGFTTDKEGAGMPADSIPGYSQASEPVSRIGKLSDQMGDVPEATPSRDIGPKVGSKASTGEPVDVPTQEPGPRFPGKATTQS